MDNDIDWENSFNEFNQQLNIINEQVTQAASSLTNEKKTYETVAAIIGFSPISEKSGHLYIHQEKDRYETVYDILLKMIEFNNNLDLLKKSVEYQKNYITTKDAANRLIEQEMEKYMKIKDYNLLKNSIEAIENELTQAGIFPHENKCDPTPIFNQEGLLHCKQISNLIENVTIKDQNSSQLNRLSHLNSQLSKALTYPLDSENFGNLSDILDSIEDELKGGREAPSMKCDFRKVEKEISKLEELEKSIQKRSSKKKT